MDSLGMHLWCAGLNSINPLDLILLEQPFYLTQVNLGSDLRVRMSQTPTPLWDLTELTLADDDTNPILTDNANRAIQGNVATQVMQPGGQLCKQWRNLGKAQVLGPLCLWQCFWWCFITNVWSVDHIIIVIYINGVCYGGSSEMCQIDVQWSHFSRLVVTLGVCCSNNIVPKLASLQLPCHRLLSVLKQSAKFRDKMSKKGLFNRVQFMAVNKRITISGETLCRDNCQLIGMSLIGLARQVQKNRD